MLRFALAAAVVVVLAAAGWLVSLDLSNRLVWDHFDVVKPGILYRSGQLEIDQLESGLRRYRIRTLVNFQYPGAGVEAEAALARRLGVDFLNLPMPGDGAGAKISSAKCWRRVRIRHVGRCGSIVPRGTCRTGSAVALYRYERDGWTVADVAAEMRRQSYHDGWLPGYVFAMVKERPFDERFTPAIRYEPNRRAADAGSVPVVR